MDCLCARSRPSLVCAKSVLSESNSAFRISSFMSPSCFVWRSNCSKSLREARSSILFVVCAFLHCCCSAGATLLISDAFLEQRGFRELLPHLATLGIRVTFFFEGGFRALFRTSSYASEPNATNRNSTSSKPLRRRASPMRFRSSFSKELLISRLPWSSATVACFTWA